MNIFHFWKCFDHFNFSNIFFLKCALFSLTSQVSETCRNCRGYFSSSFLPFPYQRNHPDSICENLKLLPFEPRDSTGLKWPHFQQIIIWRERICHFFLTIDWKKSPNCEFKSFFQVSWVTWFKRQQHLIFHKWQPPKSHTRRFDSKFSHNSNSYSKFWLPYEDGPRAVKGIK